MNRMFTMGFFDLDKGYKVWVYRIGVCSFCVSIIGIIFLLIMLFEVDDFLKRRDKNKQLYNWMERAFYM